MTVLDRIRRDSRPPHPDLQQIARTWMARTIGVRADLNRLDAGEQHDLLELIDRVSVQDEHGAGSDFTRLDKRDTKRFEQLVERAAAMPPGTFDKRREEAALKAEAASLLRRSIRPAQPRAKDETAFLALVAEHIREGWLTLDMAALLVHVLGQLFSAECLAPLGRIEGRGDDIALVIDRRMGVVSADHDPDGLVAARWNQAIDHLAQNEWLRVERLGSEMRITLGARTMKALR